MAATNNAASYKRFESSHESGCKVWMEDDAQSGNVAVHLKTKNGGEAVVLLHGGHLMSFKTRDGDELIFVSSKAIFKEGKAIRGGVPVCWPVFGAPDQDGEHQKLAQHGFLRNRGDWQIISTATNALSASAEIAIEDNEATRALWNKKFRVTLKFTLKFTPPPVSNDILLCDMTVTSNEPSVDMMIAEKPFSFTTALHTYFRLNCHVDKITIKGLYGLDYKDKPTQTIQKQKEQKVTIKGEVDRVYYGDDAENANRKAIRIVEPGNSRGIEIKLEEGFEDVVVWNPGPERSKTILDLGPDDWENYVCVESGKIKKPVLLGPNQSWSARHSIQKAVWA